MSRDRFDDDDRDDRRRRDRDDDDDDRPRRRSRGRYDDDYDRPRKTGSNTLLIVVCVVGGIIVLGGIAAALLLPAVSKVREAAARTKSTNNMKQIAIGMLNHNDARNALPAAAICDKDGKPLLSWRVAILPYIEQQALYQQFKLDEPWDSPNNKPLLQLMPKTYQNPKSPSDSYTHYRVFHGKGTAFEGTKGLSLPRDFTDGVSNTLLVIEADEAVPWTKPEELEYSSERPLPPLGGIWSSKVCLVAMGDGSVKSILAEGNERNIRAAISRNGNDFPDPGW